MTTRHLTEAQNDISPDLHYWDWFARWWEQDFSWDGLKKHEIEGQNAQEYYKKISSEFTRDGYSYNDFLIQVNGKTWFCLHAPGHDVEGNQFRETQAVKSEKISNFIAAQKSPHSAFARPHMGVILTKYMQINYSHEHIFNLHWSMLYIQDVSGRNIDYNIDINSCYINIGLGEDSNRKIKFTALKSCGYVSRIMGKLDMYVQKCQFCGDSWLGSKINCQIIIDNSQFQQIRIPHGAKNEIKNKSIINDVVIYGNNNSNISIHGSTIQRLIIDGNFDIINISGKQIGYMHFNKLVCSKMHIRSVVDEIVCKEGKFTGPCELQELVVRKGRSVFSKCVFCDEVNFSGCEFADHADFSDTVFHQKATFAKTKFRKGADFSRSHAANADQKIRGFGRINFSDAEFCRNKEGDCANFANAIFNARSIFDGVLFDGVPDFSGAQLHADTSFLNLKPFADIEGSKNPASDIYQRYHNAFRILRQHMERNADFATAFRFGRLEQKAKRRIPKGMPIWEWCISYAYEALADFGQDALRPLLWLLTFWSVASLSYFCIGWGVAPPLQTFRLAVGHAFVNALPPVSYAVAGFFKSDSLAQYDFTMALQAHPVFTGIIMTLHALFSIILIFLILLVLRRRFQIR